VHFDVRENRSLEYPTKMIEYPTVKVFFRDHNHSCWVPRTWDTLKSNNS
jgi:hypothetical protein